MQLGITTGGLVFGQRGSLGFKMQLGMTTGGLVLGQRGLSVPGLQSGTDGVTVITDAGVVVRIVASVIGEIVLVWTETETVVDGPTIVAGGLVTMVICDSSPMQLCC